MSRAVKQVNLLPRLASIFHLAFSKVVGGAVPGEGATDHITLIRLGAALLLLGHKQDDFVAAFRRHNAAGYRLISRVTPQLRQSLLRVGLAFFDLFQCQA